MTAVPFAAGSISLGLSAVGTTGSAIFARMVDEAKMAVAAGFDGVTLSEHHAGFPRYVPSPLAISASLLGRMPQGWAVASPTILPLRNPVTVAEDLAWLAALYPGRVGAGFVAGYQERDFEITGVDFDGRRLVFWEGLARLAGAFGPDSPIATDPAMAELGGAGVPLLAGVGGPVGARLAAARGVGMLVTSLRPPLEVRALVDAYAGAGGTRPAVLIRRVHVGSDAIGFGPSMADWRPAADDGAGWLDASDDALLTGAPDTVADGLIAALTHSGCRALNLRVDAHISNSDGASEQIETIGRDVLPVVRAALDEPRPTDQRGTHDRR